MTHLKIGDNAPNFDYTTSNGQQFSLENFKGKKVVLYFYPKDNTPGCTDEACNLRDNYNLLKQKGYEVIGVSPDSEKSHANFSQKFQLPFDLVPDTDKKLLESYGVWGEKKMYGKTYMGVNRTTFVIDETGKIDKIFEKVKVKDHTNQILE